MERLDQLPRCPLGARMFRHVEVNDLAAIMSNNNEDEQDAEGGRRYGEEVD